MAYCITIYEEFLKVPTDTNSYITSSSLDELKQNFEELLVFEISNVFFILHSFFIELFNNIKYIDPIEDLLGLYDIIHDNLNFLKIEKTDLNNIIKYGTTTLFDKEDEIIEEDEEKDILKDEDNNDDPSIRELYA